MKLKDNKNINTELTSYNKAFLTFKLNCSSRKYGFTIKFYDWKVYQCCICFICKYGLASVILFLLNTLFEMVKN